MVLSPVSPLPFLRVGAGETTVGVILSGLGFLFIGNTAKPQDS
jgi:hypothetical protein